MEVLNMVYCEYKTGEVFVILFCNIDQLHRKLLDSIIIISSIT
jgi:hypothetical protein